MTLPEKERERRVRLMSGEIRSAGLRLTHQRLEVIRAIAASESHPSVEEVHATVRRHVPTISLDTVYRTLATLAERGLVYRVAAGHGAARYDGNPSVHPHFVCRRCGLVCDVDDVDADVVPPSPQARALGCVESVHIEFHGLCGSCRRKGSPAGRPPATAEQTIIDDNQARSAQDDAG